MPEWKFGYNKICTVFFNHLTIIQLSLAENELILDIDTMLGSLESQMAMFQLLPGEVVYISAVLTVEWNEGWIIIIDNI